ncbi:MAG: sugar ABC transporter permease [Eubacteriales bacterium]|nr:sugar ABC transporter permease [Clostridiales bacterium]MDD7595297.1 sugar ABC transporter permease [Clostridiales bacterium]MDY4887639.1 sugar ABC transporter permease [Eubacteriales bacterium]MDY5861070.1 sugar ABC transporter permease [Eubacteriales bacterium]HCG68015.1 sugar ABC transporter permease [Clostridiales bacterium]
MTNDIQLKNTVSTKGAGAKQPKKRRIASLDRRKARSGWLFVLPFVIGFVLIYLPVIFDSIKYSFQRISVQAGGGLVTEFVGWQNYEEALINDPKFAQTLLVGIQELLFDIPAIIIFSLFMAVLLNQKMAGRAVFRAIFFIPVILSTGLMESINAQNIMAEYGEETDSISNSGQSTTAELVSAIDIEYLFSNMKVGTEIVDYVVSAINNIYDIVNRSGVQMLIFLAGLQSISPAIYESCQIDGASSWETFWKITFPMISPMILVNAVYTIIDSFTTDSNTVMKFIAAKYTQTNGNVISSAMSWIYFLIVMLIVGVVAAIFSGVVFYQKKD